MCVLTLTVRLQAGLVPVGSVTVYGTSAVDHTLTWSVPTSGVGGGVTFVATTTIVDPVSGNVTTFTSTPSTVHVAIEDYLWTATAWSTCSAACDMVRAQRLMVTVERMR